MISEVAKRYAWAIFELGQERKILDRLGAELNELSGSFQKDASFLEFFCSQFVTVDQKNQVLEKSLSGKVSSECLNFLYLLSEKSRWSLFGDIVKAFSLLQDEARQITRGVIRSAASLKPEQKKAIEERVQKTLGRQVIFSFVEDRSVLGGMIAQVGGWTFDDSIQAHLSRLNDNLRKHGGEPWRH